jgi:hypothetical protein
MAAAPDMLAALVAAREFVSFERNAVADAMGGSLSQHDAAELGDYDAQLLQIDAAIKKATQ